MEHCLKAFIYVPVCEISFLGHSRFSDKIGSDFQQKNRDRDREWESGVAFAGGETGHRHAARVNPDSHSRSRNSDSRSGSGAVSGAVSGVTFRIGSENREWEILSVRAVIMVTPDSGLRNREWLGRSHSRTRSRSRSGVRISHTEKYGYEFKFE